MDSKTTNTTRQIPYEQIAMNVLDKFLSDESRLQKVNEKFGQIVQSKKRKLNNTGATSADYQTIVTHPRNPHEFLRIYTLWKSDWDRFSEQQISVKDVFSPPPLQPLSEEQLWQMFCVGSLYAMNSGLVGQRPTDGRRVTVIPVDPYVQGTMIRPDDLFRSSNALVVLKLTDIKKDLSKRKIEQAIQGTKNLYLKALYMENNSGGGGNDGGK